MLNIYNQKNNNHDGDLITAVTPVKNAKGNANRFEDVTGEFSTSQFKRSFWFITHKVLLYKITVGILFFLSVVFWMFSLWLWGGYIFYGIQSDIALHNDLSHFPDYSGIKDRYAPVPFQITGVNVYAGGSKTYDLAAEVSNPNKNFIVHFDYYFSIDNNKTPVQKGFLLVNESRPMVYYGYKDGYPNGVNLIIENVEWQRVSAHTVPNPMNWQNDRLNFNIQDFSFSAPQTTDGVSANVVEFKITNNSAFGYRDGLFVVGLVQDGGVVGVMPLVLKDFKSLETRSVDLRNFSDNLSISDIQLFPLIDIYKQDVYLAPER